MIFQTDTTTRFFKALVLTVQFRSFTPPYTVAAAITRFTEGLRDYAWNFWKPFCSIKGTHFNDIYTWMISNHHFLSTIEYKLYSLDIGSIEYTTINAMVSTGWLRIKTNTFCFMMNAYDLHHDVTGHACPHWRENPTNWGGVIEQFPKSPIGASNWLAALL